MRAEHERAMFFAARAAAPAGTIAVRATGTGMGVPCIGRVAHPDPGPGYLRVNSGRRHSRVTIAPVAGV